MTRRYFKISLNLLSLLVLESEGNVSHNWALTSRSGSKDITKLTKQWFTNKIIYCGNPNGKPSQGLPEMN